MRKNLKILFIPKWYPSRVHRLNGDFIRRHALAVAMKHNVAVLFISADPAMKEKAYDMEYEMDNSIATLRVFYNNSASAVPLVSSLVSAYRYINACRKGVRAIKEKFGSPEVTHIHVLARTFLPACFFKSPIVVSEHWSGYLPEDGTYKGLMKKTLTEIAIRSASAVTAVSERLKKAMLAHGLKNTYSVVPNVVDINLFSLASGPVKSDKFIFLHISNLDDRAKNVSGMINAVKELSKSRSDFELHIVGEGEGRNKLEALAKQLGLFGKLIFFFGEKRSDEVAELMNSSHCVLLFSNYETFGVVIIEALASGLPVITSSAGGVTDQITPELGMLVQPRDVVGLSAAMGSMIDHKANYDSLEIRKFALKMFSYEAVAGQFDAVYQKVIRK